MRDQHAPRGARGRGHRRAVAGRALVIHDPALAALAEPAAAAVGAEAIPTGEPYEALLASGDGAALPAWPDDEERPIGINATSGTTGRPKGVVVTHRGAYLNALAQVLDAGLTPDTRTCGRCRCSTATAGATRGR